MSWVALQDVLGVVEHLAYTDSTSGAVNVVAPTACTNAEFTAVLGQVLRRPTLFPVPAAALRMLFGDLAQPLLLSNSTAAPKKIVASGYEFAYPTLEGALRFECCR